MSNFTDAKSADAVFSMKDGYSFANALTTDGYVVEFPKAVCVALVVTAGSAPTGSLDVEGSLDGVNYFSLTALTGGSVKSFTTNGTYAVNINGVAIRYVRAVVARVSGTGTLALRCSVV